MTKEIKELHKKIDGMIAVMATKDDLKGFATKDDLKNFLTKEDGKAFATKDDIGRLTSAIIKNSDDFKWIKESMATKKELDLFLNRIDDYAIEIRNYGRKALVYDHRFNELEPKVLNHEQRISALEAKQ